MSLLTSGERRAAAPTKSMVKFLVGRVSTPDPSEGGPAVAEPGGPTMEATFLGSSLLGLRPRRLILVPFLSGGGNGWVHRLS